MQTRIPQWIWGVITCIVLFLLVFPMVLIYFPFFYRSSLFAVLSLPAIVKTITFLVGYSLLKPLNTLKFWKFMIYIISMTGANGFLYSLIDFQWSFRVVEDYFLFFYYILPFVVSVGLGIGFLIYLFGISKRSAILMGILLGFTNAQTFIVNLPVCH